MRDQNSRACCAGATGPPFLLRRSEALVVSTEMWTCAPLDDRVHPVAPVGPRHGDPQLCFNETSAKPRPSPATSACSIRRASSPAATRPRLARRPDRLSEQEGVRIWAGSLCVLDVDAPTSTRSRRPARQPSESRQADEPRRAPRRPPPSAYRKPAPLAQRDENDGHPYYAKARVPHALAFRGAKERVKTPPRREDARATGPRRWAGQALAREAPRRGAACGVRFAGVVVPCGRCSSCVGGGNVEPDFAVGYPLETACPSVESRETCVRADLAVKRSGARAAVLMSDTDVARVKRALAAPRQ